MKSTHIEYSIREGVATICMVPPVGKPVTLDEEVLSELEQAIEKVNRDSPQLVLLRSDSEKFFCVGANLNVLKETTEQSIVSWVMRGHAVLNKLEDLSMPVAAVVEGYAIGGGLELAMACDLIFASDTAKFAQSEAGLGFIPGWGGTRRLTQRIGVAKAKYYFYSGKMIDATTAQGIGLIDIVCNKEVFGAEIREFTKDVLAQNSNALSQFKVIVNNEHNRGRDENAAVEAFRSVSCLQDPDAKQRLDDFLNKRRKK